MGRRAAIEKRHSSRAKHIAFTHEQYLFAGTWLAGIRLEKAAATVVAGGRDPTTEVWRRRSRAPMATAATDGKECSSDQSPSVSTHSDRFNKMRVGATRMLPRPISIATFIPISRAFSLCVIAYLGMGGWSVRLTCCSPGGGGGAATGLRGLLRPKCDSSLPSATRRVAQYCIRSSRNRPPPVVIRIT